MKKKIVFLTSALIMAAVSMWGCGSDGNSATKGSDVSKTTTTQAQTTTAETTTPEPTTEEPTTSGYSGDYSEFSTEVVEYGVGTRRLDDGRFEGAVYCQNKYSQYKVEFIKENEKVIYLTFDEGYENGYTGAILDTLKEKGVKAVFLLQWTMLKESRIW